MLVVYEINFGLITNWIQIIVSLLIMAIAYKGLSTWQKQHKLQTDTELAEGIYLSTYLIMSKLMQITSYNSAFERVKAEDFPSFSSQALLYQSMFVQCQTLESQLIELYHLQKKFELRYDDTVKQARIILTGCMNELAVAATVLRDHYNNSHPLSASEYKKWHSMIFQPIEEENAIILRAKKAEHILDSLCKKLAQGSYKASNSVVNNKN